jgi:hypothetical protein
MLVQQQKLLSQLDQFGWKLVDRQVWGLEWWADQIWIIQNRNDIP